MFFRQFYLGCLAHASYLIGDGGEAAVVDPRRPGEYASGHVPGSVSYPLDRLARELDTVPAAGRVVIICAGGYRSSIAASLLLHRRGAEPVNVVGGTSAWVAAGLPVE